MPAASLHVFEYLTVLEVNGKHSDDRGSKGVVQNPHFVGGNVARCNRMAQWMAIFCQIGIKTGLRSHQPGSEPLREQPDASDHNVDTGLIYTRCHRPEPPKTREVKTLNRRNEDQNVI